MNMNTDELLFSKYDWFSIEKNQIYKLNEEIASYDGNRLLNTSVDDLCDYFQNKWSIEAPVLDTNSIVADQWETKIDVSNNFSYGPSIDGRPILADGNTIEITIPFSGEHQVFYVRPNTFSMNPPRATVSEGRLTLHFTGINQTADQLKLDISRRISQIQESLGHLKRSADHFNASIRSIALHAISARREKLLANQNLVSSLGFSLKENANSPLRYTVPTARRKIAPVLPRASSAPYKAEPALSDSDYNHILDVLQNMAQVMELSPKAFTNMNEETLRTHFLVQLNGHYEGQATGETFNYEGKTDILIRQDGRNIFIGECKFWKGPKILTETIDQLLSYSSWRDTKVAILIFNRNKELSKVIASVTDTIALHSNFKRMVGALSETSFRYLFSHRDDSNREMILTVLIFDIPK